MGFFAEFGRFLGSHKKLWLAPLIIAAVLVVLLVLTTGNSTIAPFFYTLF
jgi:hypothetical protein